MTPWLDNSEQWKRLADAIVKAGEYGIDTETYNQPDKTSPQHRTRIHCWSVGLLYGNRGPRGYRQSVGRVLPVGALDCPELVSALQLSTGWAHNSPHDEHSFANHGINLKLNDSLQWLRVAMPDKPEGYGLKDAERWALGLPSRPSFIQTITHPATVVSIKKHKERGCICGKSPCRARATSDFCDSDGVWKPHIRVEWTRFTPTSRTIEARWAVTDFVPGHERWDQWLEYSLADAVRGIMLVDWLRGVKGKFVVNPWVLNALQLMQ